MSSSVSILYPDMDVFEAIDVLVHKNASGAPVVDEQKRLVGILTEKDCLRVVSNDAFGTLSGGRVKDFMSPVRHTVEASMDVFTVAHLFLSNNFPSLPVVNDGMLVGRITRLDLLRGILSMQKVIEARRLQDERDLRMKQAPASINDLQRLAASERVEHLAALFRMRHHPEDEW